MRKSSRPSRSLDAVRVKWLRRALANLREEVAYIARDNPSARRKVPKMVRFAVGHLRPPPSMGRAGRVPGTRELVVPNTPYIIPYRVRADRLEILRVFHASRHWPESF